ncbi:hypothetical protein CYMTET_20515 [Cymbomonas tetramitiformis]|uniref:Uncharacterized protein n=1 Tax=Cymbomonas tetramitiformis TaxID=36881 RepID=A0AAE0G592_9CHLO|nr:hypothetical protein CYMTET_20515 [Cymbomonas tetramitiformis]
MPQCQVPAMPFKHPEKIEVRRNGELVRLLEASALAIEAANAARVPALPARIQNRIDRPPVAMYNGKNTGVAQKRAEQYVQDAQWELSYDQMTVGSFAVALAVESENDRFAFRDQLRRGEWSEPLYLVKVEGRIPSQHELKYIYHSPSKYTDAKKKHLGKLIASHDGAYVSRRRPRTDL